MPFDANDPDTKAALAAAVAEAVGKLETKNRDLIAEMRTAKKGREIDPAEVERLENELSTVQGQLTEANKALKVANVAAEKATKDLEAERGYTSSLLVDGGLVTALTEAGVKNPAHLKAAAALLKATGKAEVTAGEGGARLAMVDGKPLADFVKAWAAGDDGKAFVAAPANSGTGAPGGGGKPGTANPFKQGDGFNMTEQARLYRENPTQATALAAEAGVNL